MSFTPVYITDIIGDVVTATANTVVNKADNRTLVQQINYNESQALGLTSNINSIRYSKSSFAELIETLEQADKTEEYRDSKYPLIHLVRDFYEDRGKSDPAWYAEVSLNIIFIHQTVNTYKITDRENKVFKPVLYPIYYTFFENLARHPQIEVVNPKLIPHRKWDRAYWGNRQLQDQSKNKLADYVDAIECQNINLKISFKNC